MDLTFSPGGWPSSAVGAMALAGEKGTIEKGSRTVKIRS
jgi:hypothetical protein